MAYVAVERMADHLLSERLAVPTLRPLAASAGTSDRMLLYYFADRNEILSVTLHRIAEACSHSWIKLFPQEGLVLFAFCWKRYGRS